jgi:hypothetical protein
MVLNGEVVCSRVVGTSSSVVVGISVSVVVDRGGILLLPILFLTSGRGTILYLTMSLSALKSCRLLMRRKCVWGRG